MRDEEIPLANKRLDNKVAIVTGAGTGIGQAIAVVFAGEGARVVGTGRRLDKLQETVLQAATAGGEFFPEVADVSLAGDVTRTVEACLKRFGRVDILVNNAGILVRGGITAISEADFDRTLAINVKGAFLCSKAVAPYMIAQKEGCILMIAGGVANRPNINAAYSASKAAMVALTKSMALELSPQGIRVNAINPGPIATGMTLPAWNDPVRAPDVRRRSLFGRIADPAEVAAGAVFLVSDEARFITGAELAIDAGWVLT
jgi:NAD(P)-dependent dehydrogenase (short-subunit alcohol dehydrogenase family)